jgi:SAM-dependent methyltransferase
MKCAIAFCTPLPRIPGPHGPRYEPVTVEFHRARNGLVMPTGFSSIEIQADGMEVGEARNRAVEITMGIDPRPEFLFFLDYDVLPAYDAVTKLFYRAKCYPEHDIFCGIYTAKGSPAEPLIYTEPGQGCYWDWTVGDLIRDKITGCHMGLTLIRTSLFERMGWDDPDKPLFKTVKEAELKDGGLCRHTGTEDLFFCKRVQEEIGGYICVDTSVLAGHIQNSTGQIFGLPNDSPPVERAKWLRFGKPEEPEEEKEFKKALDIGAGSQRREWDGYKTYTSDIRPEAKPDFVCDTRLLNLPNESFDLVASSHHLEHFGRYEQAKLWEEMYRILKPGGRMEHTLPNLMWAAWKIANKEYDDLTSILDVLYGSQEEGGMDREWNTHYCGYVPEMAEALAEKVGLVDVEVKTYKDDPKYGFSMVLTGAKPGGVAESPPATIHETNEHLGE